MDEKYAKLLDRPHHESKKHPRMSRLNRAAQFSPFAALTGYDDLIRESARVTHDAQELDEMAVETLNRKLALLSRHLDVAPEIRVTYFKPDEKKAGGEYVSFTGTPVRIDEYGKALIFSDKTVIFMQDIAEIQGDLFDKEQGL